MQNSGGDQGKVDEGGECSKSVHGPESVHVQTRRQLGMREEELRKRVKDVRMMIGCAKRGVEMVRGECG